MKHVFGALLLLSSLVLFPGQTTETFPNYVGALPAATLPLSGSEQMYLLQTGISKQSTVANLPAPMSIVFCQGINDQPAIQNAINAAATSNRTAIVAIAPSASTNNCVITSGITMGNGSAGGASTQYGIKLVGLNAGWAPFSAGPTAGRVNITTNFTSTGTALTIAGPLGSWAVEDININCDTGFANNGMLLSGVIHGHVKNVSISQCGGIALQTTSTGNVTGTAFNVIDDLYVQMPQSGFATAVGVELTGVPNFDSFLNTFNRLHVTPNNAGHTCLILQYADSNAFYGFDCNPAGAKAVVFDYSVNTGFPNANVFFGFEPYNNSITNTGSPGSGAPNSAWDFSTANGASPPSLSHFNTATDTFKFLSATNAITLNGGASFDTSGDLTLSANTSGQLNVNNPSGTLSVLNFQNAGVNLAQIFWNNPGPFLQSNVPTGSTYLWQINSVTQAQLVANNFASTGSLQTGTTTVGALPTCNTAAKGRRYFVTDLNQAVTYHTTVTTGGGSTNLGVLCDGTNWYMD